MHNIIIVTPNALSSLTSTIDAISTNLPLEGDSVPMTVMSDDHGVAVTAVRLNVSSFQGVSFDINATDDGFMNGINTYTFASNVTSISLPDTLFVELGTNVLNDSFISTFTVFESDNLFVSSGEVMPVIASSVISAEIPGLNVFDLENPITLAFQMYQELDNVSLLHLIVILQ